MNAGGRGRSLLPLLLGATLLIGGAWAVLVPPFEAADEGPFYKQLVLSARGEVAGSRLYAAVMRVPLALAGTDDRPFQEKYNPSFRFVSNARGRVNMYMHGALDGFRRADVNRMYLLRFLTLGLWMGTLSFVFLAARLVFEDEHKALLTAGLCLALPELSFFSSKIHPEATSVLLASAAYWLLTARALGRVGRAPAWLGAAALVAVAPFADRQAYFVMLLVPAGLIISESTWRARALLAAAMLVPVPIALKMHRFVGLQRDLDTWLAPLSPSYRFGWWNRDTGPYLAWEFTPKLFFGFCGWLGQPSILLPSFVYAALAAAFALGIAGLAAHVPALRHSARKRRVAAIFAAGLVFTIGPILYTNIVISRTTTGRWLYPSIVPIMIGCVSGWFAFARGARRRPQAVSIAIAVAAAALAIVWLGPAGDGMRSSIRGNHYGNVDHLIATINATIGCLVIAAATVKLWPIVEQRLPSADSAQRTSRIVMGAWSLNLLLLAAFIVPLYRPLDAAGLAAIVRDEAMMGEYVRATSLYQIAVAAYPGSVPLREVARDVPLLVLRGGDAQALAELQRRLAEGQRLRTRDELMALARAAQTTRAFAPEILRSVVESAPDAGDFREPAALLRGQASDRARGESAAAVVKAAGGLAASGSLHGQATLEGYTVHRVSQDVTEVTIYFRPSRAWSGRTLWLHAYPAGSGDYLVIDPAPPAFDNWRPDDLAWETFPLPANAKFTLYTGVTVSGDLGPPYPIGTIGG